MAISISSKALIKCSLPDSTNFLRYAISIYSSAGTPKNTTSPASSGKTPDFTIPQAAASMVEICRLWPQACAAPVAGSAFGLVGQPTASSSPKTAAVGPGLPPFARPLTPLIAKPVCGSKPRSRINSATLAAVLTSLNPNSGSSLMLAQIAFILSAYASIAAHAFSFKISFVILVRLQRTCLFDTYINKNF